MPLNPVLAIDTSTEIAGVGVLGGGARVALSWDAGRNQATTVLDQIDRCLALAGVAPADLAGIVVASGPGMFNGLRVGMSLAKGLAYGLERPVIGIPTLRITADPWTGLGRHVIAVVAAGRGRVVWQQFSLAGEPRGEPVNMAAADLVHMLLADPGGPDVLVAGELPDEQAAVLADHGVWLRTGATGQRDPLALARLGDERLRRMGGDDLPALEPLYIHSRPEAAAKA
jgi:tRNA threonylcarbamoyladenosine biosynthesis protein TsaB